ncbi:hypothetical protein [Bradyrhizobium sp. SYSU BS000235]|uniref:hypothetical protein n=1 Tax=Bradyrhizobium sp. SYSU BS000235 TaxID=3411332 RepID=UPI003C783696
MTSIAAFTNNAYAQFGSAYARAAAIQPSLANILNAADTGSSVDPNAATNLTLSDAARARLASAATTPDHATVVSNARKSLDDLYAAAQVTRPLTNDGKQTIDLSKLDRRSLFAISSNAGGKFTGDEQSVASNELKSRLDAALAPAAATAAMTNNYTVVYKAALNYLDAAGSEEKATSTWAAQHAAVQKGYQAAQQKPDAIPSGIPSDPVAAYLAKNPHGTPAKVQKDFGTVAKDVRTALDTQAQDANQNGRELVYEPGRKTGQLVDFSTMDGRALSAIALNQNNLFSLQEVIAAKKELNSRTRNSMLSSMKQSQSSGDPLQFSLGVLQSYSAMSDEERLAVGWTPAFRDTLVQNYRSTSSMMSMMQAA